MAEMKRYPLRLSDSDRKQLAELAEHHQRIPADMIRFLIRNEHARIFKQAKAPAAPPSDDDDFIIVEDDGR
jgi:hypothetical protein